MFVSQKPFFRTLVAVHVVLGVAFQFFLKQIAPVFWVHAHVPSPQETLLIGLMGAQLLSLVPLLLNIRSEELYRWAHVAQAVLFTCYILFAHFLATMQPHPLVFFIVLSLAYAFSANGGNGGRASDLAPWQRSIQAFWALVTLANALHFLFAPEWAESLYLSPPAASDYSRITMLCFAALQLQVGALTQSATSKTALRDGSLVLALGWFVQVYLLHGSVVTNVTRFYPLLFLASAYAFHV